MALVPGYQAYFSFSKAKLGYSGVVVYVKEDTMIQPYHVYEGITGILDTKKQHHDDAFDYNFNTPAHQLDAEGRCIILDFGYFILFNVYFPHESDETRSEFKMDYHRCVQKRIDIYLQQGKQVILVGDINAVHEEIDHCDPKQSMKEHGIDDFKDLPHRRWIDNMIAPKGPLIDMTRYFHPQRQKMFTCWNTRLNSRPSNFGTRIDYILTSEGMKKHFKYSDIQADIMGSDHCPVYADFAPIPEVLNDEKQYKVNNGSPLLSMNFAEFRHQEKLFNYFSTGNKPAASNIAAIATVTSTTDVAFPSTVTGSSIVNSQKRSIESSSPINPDSSRLKRFKASEKSSSPTNSRTIKNNKRIDLFFQKKPTSPQKSPQATAETNIAATTIPVNRSDSQSDSDHSRRLDTFTFIPPNEDTTKKAWTSIFQTPEIPKCKGHGLPCLERTVTKKGPNLGRVFYICSKPKGPEGAPPDEYQEYQCDFFLWKKKR
ncbi:Endonuclease/exonuclease/phosphatase [Mycotypha africana]|uniref:Endonuclease/exonuclease/phosphatase n=1 Tax=Mycotypha africana TaxID=64632 RepID=UPI0023005C3B|nr:Endonuclease/exonuclease/phosphatase [Mycotypha africana]KAI8971766.1 Endonuclease/exonuclease/phosphatase [Mycotypha africana]